MYGVATPFYQKVRQAAGLNIIHGSRVENPPPADEEVLADLLASPRPFWLTGVGLGGFVVILWLMMFKPF